VIDSGEQGRYRVVRGLWGGLTDAGQGELAMRYRCSWLLALALAATVQAVAEPFDAAAAFGARETVAYMSLSPDGRTVAYIAPAQTRATAVITLSLDKGAKPKAAMWTDGKPERIRYCDWVANDRLVCEIYWVGPPPDHFPMSRLMAVNSDGSNPRLLARRRNADTYGVMLGDGQVIDYLPEEDGVVLMTRVTLPDDKTGSHLGSSKFGLGVDRIDTRTLTSTVVQAPLRDAVYYISDGHGALRILAEREQQAQSDTGVIRYSFRARGGDHWQTLCTYNAMDHSGFRPVAVDRDLNVAYGFKKKDGRFAVYTLSLDGNANETLVYSRDDVDLEYLIQVGRHQRVVGVQYALAYRQAQYTDPKFAALSGGLDKALAGRTGLYISDASADESKVLIHASSDVDAGVYYLLDRGTHHLDTFLVNRAPLEGVKLASVKPVSYPARDGANIPGYLTLPPGRDDAKGLPAIVLPHGGPSARDEWGFDWLSQYFAAQGYAVLQPNFRGSAGYGDAWSLRNGFQSWQVAIGDVLDGGRWLVHEGIADPAQLAVFGWSYGGYAALQSVATDSSVFKVAVAVAPVTDLPTLVEQERGWSDYYLMRDFVGHGAQAREGSPAQNAGRIKVPVLLFHGTEDVNVRILQSQVMDRALAAAGVKHELVTFDGLDHQLEDSAVRSTLLSRSDAFMRAAFTHP
jgi:dipeptidyl aminopeptidase/acylaminoacyl peptidase